MVKSESLNNPQIEADRLAEAMRLIKKAHKHPVIYTTEQTVEFISRKINLGHPELIPYLGRGARSKKTQYDLAYERRKGFYHRLTRLPTLGAKGRLIVGDKTLTYVKNLAEQLSLINTPKRGRVRRVYIYISLNPKKLKYHDRKTLSAYLTKLGY